MPKEKILPLWRYGQFRLEYLKHHSLVLYTKLKTTFKLNEHPYDVDLQAREIIELLTSQMAQA